MVARGGILDTRKKFLLVGQHTDEEITDFLQREAEAGWWLKENNGNWFVFIKKPYEGRRLCSYSVVSSKLGCSAEDVLYGLLPDLKKSGWGLVCLGNMENIADMRRHVFLCENEPCPENPVPTPESEEKCHEDALKRGLLKSISNLLLCVLYLGVLVYASITKADFFASWPTVVFGITTMLMLVPSLVLSIGAVASALKARRDPDSVIRSGSYRLIDTSVRLIFSMLVVLALFLVVDSIIF